MSWVHFTIRGCHAVFLVGPKLTRRTDSTSFSERHHASPRPCWNTHRPARKKKKEKKNRARVSRTAHRTSARRRRAASGRWRTAGRWTRRPCGPSSRCPSARRPRAPAPPPPRTPPPSASRPKTLAPSPPPPPLPPPPPRATTTTTTTGPWSGPLGPRPSPLAAARGRTTRRAAG